MIFVFPDLSVRMEVFYFIVNILSVSPPILWQDYLLVGVENKVDFDQSFALLIDLATQTSNEILSDELIFTPLLPDDESPITERSNSISEWCAGFVSGLSVGGADKKLDLSSEEDEFVKDVISISRMEKKVSEGENSEVAYSEIVEYIRVGVIFIYQQVHENTESKDNIKEILH